MNFEEIYKKNLNYLKKKSPDFFNKIVNQDISHLELVINKDKSFNIKENGALIYPSNADEMISKQVNFFLSKPAFFYHKPCADKESKVSKTTNRAVLRILSKSPLLKDEKLVYSSYNNPSKTIPFFILFGIGTGKVLKEIIEKKEIINICIIDKDYSFIKLSMHIMDWTGIFEKFFYRPESFNFIVGSKDNSMAYQIINLIYGHNPMYTFYTQYLTHLNSPFFDTVKKTISENMYHAQTGWGFFEDERISLQHTLTNMKKTSRIFKPNKLLKGKVLVIGSGPSLDKDIEKIKEISENVFIISCGTAIRTLWKNKIIPDMHIEIERTFSTYKVLKSVDENFLRKVTLVGLNVLHPKIKSLFKEYYMLFRDNDAGSSLYLNTKTMDFSNPTVVNCGFNLACSLGFEDIYLLGVDNGFKNPKKHHSDGTVHEVKDSLAYKTEEKDYFIKKVKGNFGGELYTTGVFSWSKQRLENCLKTFHKSRDINVLNCGDGAYIKGTTPYLFTIKDFETNKKNKKNILSQFKIIKSKKISKELETKLEKQALVFKNTIQELILFIDSYKFDCSDDVFLFLDQTYQIIRKSMHLKDGQVTYSFLSGTIKVLYSFIYSHLLASKKNEEYNIKFVLFCKDEIKELVIFIHDEFIKIKNNSNNFH